MRVVRVVTRLNRGGPLRQLLALVPGLAAEGIGGPVLVGEPAPGEEDASGELVAAGAQVERVPGLVRGVSPVRDAQAWRWLRRRLHALRPDVVHTHLGKAGALGRTAAAAVGVRAVVHTVHGHHLDLGGALARGTRLAERALSRTTTAVVCLSERQRRDLVERHHVVPPDRAVVLGPGFDVEGFRRASDPAAAAALRARLAPDGVPLVLWLGRFVHAKDPLGLLAAAQAADPRAFRLVLAGDGPLRRETLRRARALRAAGRVVAVGAVRDAATWVAASDAVVLASRSEGTPLSVLEAMAVGRPVVATAVGGVEDVVEDGRTGLLVPPGNPSALAFALARVVADHALSARLVAAASDGLEARVGARRLVEGTAALYRRLLA
ncbi:MAG: glycosyltransferase [Planctomycetes bacterium]|nr:glycosyltransferase [Planctomycetota bacterium]